MIFRNDIEEFALNLNGDDKEQFRFHLVCSTTSEVKKHFRATFNKINLLKAEGYSAEAITGFRKALIEVLVELRVRGFEADTSGKLYKTPVFVPVPDNYECAQQRQVVKLKNLREEQLVSICTSTLKAALKNAGQSSKASFSMNAAAY